MVVELFIMIEKMIYLEPYFKPYTKINQVSLTEI